MIKRMALGLGILGLAGPFLWAHPLPVLFVPPAHYRVLKRMGGGGWYYGGTNNGPVNESLLRHFRRAARRVGANAVLLRPLCKHLWHCYSVGGGRVHPTDIVSNVYPIGCSVSYLHLVRHCGAFQAYTAEAIRVRGAPCPYPGWLCRLMQPRKPIPRDVRDRLSRQRSEILGNVRRWAYGISLSEPRPSPRRIAGLATRAVRVTGTFARGAACPVRVGYRYHESDWPETFPLISLPFLADVAGNGRVEPARVAFLRPEGLTAAARLVALLRRMRFDPKPAGGKPLLLVADWHLVLLRSHAKIPSDIVCWYPPCPAKGCHRGRMAKRLAWRVIAASDGGRAAAIDPIAKW